MSVRYHNNTLFCDSHMPLIFHTVYNSRRNFLTNSRLNHHLLYSFARSQKQLKQNVQIQNFYYSLRLKTLKKIQLDHDSRQQLGRVALKAGP